MTAAAYPLHLALVRSDVLANDFVAARNVTDDVLKHMTLYEPGRTKMESLVSALEAYAKETVASGSLSSMLLSSSRQTSLQQRDIASARSKIELRQRIAANFKEALASAYAEESKRIAAYIEQLFTENLVYSPQSDSISRRNVTA